MNFISLNKEEVLALRAVLERLPSSNIELDGVELYHCRHILARLIAEQNSSTSSTRINSSTV